MVIIQDRVMNFFLLKQYLALSDNNHRDSGRALKYK